MSLKKILLLAALLGGLLLYVTRVEMASDEVKLSEEQPFQTRLVDRRHLFVNVHSFILSFIILI